MLCFCLVQSIVDNNKFDEQIYNFQFFYSSFWNLFLIFFFGEVVEQEVKLCNEVEPEG